MGSKQNRTISGAPASAPVVPPGQTYGEGERQMESQRRTPLPAGPPAVPGANGSAPAINANSTPAAPAEQPLARRMARALMAAQSMRSGPGLYAPTQRPSEPITTGLAMGAGAGPEALRTGDRVARTLRLMASVSGDPRFAELADIAARQGR